MAAVADQPRLRGIVPALALGVGAGAAVVSGSKAIQAGFVASVISIPTVWMVISVERFGLKLLMASLLLLPPLPLPFGDSGPHPAAAVAALCVMAALIRLPEWRVPLTPVTLSWGALLAAMALSLGSALVNSGTGVAVASAARLGLFSIGPFVFLSAAFGPDRLSPAKAMRATRWLFWVAAAAAAVGVLDFFYQLPAPAGFEPQFVWLDSGVFRRAQGLFYESSTLGNFCAFFLVMIAVALTEPRERRPMQSAWLCAGAAVLGTALLLSYSRASVSTVVLGVLVLAFLRRKQRALLKMGIGLAVCALAVLVITTVWFPEFATATGHGWDSRSTIYGPVLTVCSLGD